MDIMEAMKARHSVRQYEEREIEPALLQELQAEADACNRRAACISRS